MSGKINNGQTAKKWIPWAIVILLVAAAAGFHYYFTTQTMISKSAWWNNLVVQTLSPSFEIQQYAIIESINQFGGSETEPAQFWQAIGMSLLGFLIVLMLAPWMLVKGYLSMEKSGSPDKLSPVWIAGAAVIVAAISSHMNSMGAYLLLNNENADRIEASRTTDELRSVMMDLAFDASERMILSPDDVQGEAMAIALESLPSYDEWEKFDISITEQAGDSLLILSGTLRDQELSEASFSRSVTMRITPKNDELFDYVN